jgi:effector-binding domain-containing protein
MRIMGSFMDKWVGKDYEHGLTKLKTVLESMPDGAGAYNVEVTQIKTIAYMAVRDTASVNTISQKLGMSYGMIGAVLKKQGINMAGAPFAIYHSGGKGGPFDLEAAVPVDKPGKSDGKVIAGELKEGNVAMVKYFGDYSKINSAYEAVQGFIQSNNKKVRGFPWESYVSDPMNEKDTAKWETDLYFPIE